MVWQKIRTKLLCKRGEKNKIEGGGWVEGKAPKIVGRGGKWW